MIFQKFNLYVAKEVHFYVDEINCTLMKGKAEDQLYNFSLLGTANTLDVSPSLKIHAQRARIVIRTTQGH